MRQNNRKTEKGKKIIPPKENLQQLITPLIFMSKGKSCSTAHNTIYLINSSLLHIIQHVTQVIAVNMSKPMD